MSKTTQDTKPYLRTFTNPITGTIVVGEPKGPPLAKFKKGEEELADQYVKEHGRPRY